MSKLAMARPPCGGRILPASRSTRRAEAKEATVQLITLDPGHFHAALVQKFMLPGVSPEVRVFAPEGDDVAQHLKRIEGFNTRADKPTQWVEKVYTGPDYLEQAARHAGSTAMRSVARRGAVDRRGDLRQQRAQDRIHRDVRSMRGINVLADKPMVITPAELRAARSRLRHGEAEGRAALRHHDRALRDHDDAAAGAVAAAGVVRHAREGHA